MIKRRKYVLLLSSFPILGPIKQVIVGSMKTLVLSQYFLKKKKSKKKNLING
jgi:hypothetical protein